MKTNRGFKIAAFFSFLIIIALAINTTRQPEGSFALTAAKIELILAVLTIIAIWILFLMNDYYKKRTGRSFIIDRFFGRDQTSSIIQSYDKAKLDQKQAEEAKRNRATNPRSAHPKGIIFGRSEDHRWVFSPAINAITPHTFVYGPTGSGKTQNIILPSIAMWPKNLHIFGIDVSGDITDTIKSNNWMRDPNRIKYIDFTSWNSDSRFDVFSEIRALTNKKGKPPEEIRSEQESKIEEIAYCLLPVPKAGDSSNSYFTDGGRSLLTAALLAGFFNNKDFVETLKWLTESINPLQEIEGSGVHSAIVKVHQFAGQNEKNVAGVRGEAVKAAEKITKNGIASRVLTPPKSGENASLISIADIENYDIFIRIQMVDLTVLSPIIGLILRQCMNFFYSRSLAFASQHPILIVADELASYAKYWNNLTNDIRNLRKYGARFLICCQDFGSLDDTIGKAGRETIVANTGYKVILSSFVPADQRDLSALIGKEEQKRRVQSYSPYHHTSYTDRWDLIPAIAPEDFGTLSAKDQLILISPEGWERITTAPFWKHQKELQQLKNNDFFYKFA